MKFYGVGHIFVYSAWRDTKICCSLFLFLLWLLPTAYAADVAVFSSPENSFTALSQFSDSEKSFNVSVYEFTSPEIMYLVLEGADKILVEKNPVGGIKEIEQKILCNLEDHGKEVKLYSSPQRFLHAKYMVGSSVLVSSENLGAGFFKNRGWGLIVEDEKARKEFQNIFNKDFKNSEPFECSMPEFNFSSNENFQKTEIRKYGNQKVETVFAPENSVEMILGLLDSANKSIYMEQFYIYKNWGSKKSPKSNLFLEKVLEKAKQGVEIKILLDSNTYNTEPENPNSNFNTANYINNFAKENKLNLEAKLADLENLGVDKIHNKGIIVDEKTVFVSSINWNENSPTKNREVGIIVEGEAASYFSDIFKKDFSTEKPGLTGKIVDRGTELVLIILMTTIIYGAYKFVRRNKRNFY